MDKKTFVFIVGATASGKSSLGYELAKVLNTPIISCDSQQVYKNLDIGTAKPTKKEQELVKHELIDIVSEDSEFTVSDYLEKFNRVIEDIDNPLIVGGTGLYVNSLIYGYNLSNAKKDSSIRDRLNSELNEKGIDFMFEKLKQIDPLSCEKIHKNNTVRVIRALEIFEQTGKIKSQIQTKVQEPLIKHLIFAINTPREILYDKINKRVDEMIDNGLVNEVERVFNTVKNKDCQSLRAIGYKEIVEYLNGKVTIDIAIDNIKKNTRHYAKRQLTWVNHQLPQTMWLDSSKSKDEMIKIILNEYKKLK